MVGDLKSQELANTTWAFAKAGHASPALFDALAAAAASKVSDVKPQESADTAWALVNRATRRRCSSMP